MSDQARVATITMLKELCDKRADLLLQAQLASAPFVLQAAAAMSEIDKLARTLLEIPDEGQVSLNVEGVYTVKLARTTKRSANTAALMEKWAELPAAVQSAFKFDADIQLKQLRALSEEDAAKASQFYSTSIGDPKLSIEVRK